MGWYPIRIRNKMHRHETESQGNFEGFLDNYQSISDVVMSQQSVQISFWKDCSHYFFFLYSSISTWLDL